MFYAQSQKETPFSQHSTISSTFLEWHFLVLIRASYNSIIRWSLMEEKLFRLEWRRGQQCMNNRCCNWICSLVKLLHSYQERERPDSSYCVWYLTSVDFVNYIWRWKDGNCTVSAVQKPPREKLVHIMFLLRVWWFWKNSPWEVVRTMLVKKKERKCLWGRFFCKALTWWIG